MSHTDAEIDSFLALEDWSIRRNNQIAAKMLTKLSIKELRVLWKHYFKFELDAGEMSKADMVAEIAPEYAGDQF